ncbi:MAG: hypothetical protein AMXMBFR83_26180 [Phycisphaerae bacterium]
MEHAPAKHAQCEKVFALTNHPFGRLEVQEQPDHPFPELWPQRQLRPEHHPVYRRVAHDRLARRLWPEPFLRLQPTAKQRVPQQRLAHQRDPFQRQSPRLLADEQPRLSPEHQLPPRRLLELVSLWELRGPEARSPDLVAQVLNLCSTGWKPVPRRNPAGPRRFGVTAVQPLPAG